MGGIRQSTQEEIDARRAQIAAAACPGDGVYMEFRSTHDWRLWERKRLFHFGAKPGEGSTDPFFTETWYCTRCRKIEERKVR